MAEIGNQSLAFLVLVAMAVSLAGTFATFSLITQPERAPPSTGFITGITNVSIPREADITLKVQLVNFGEMSLGDKNSTSNYDPHPFIIENNGSVFVNVSVNATDLWTSTPNPTGNYLVNASDENKTGSIGGPDGWATDFIDMPPNAPAYDNLITCLNYSNSNDAMAVHINITVPGGEPTGYKESLVTFTGEDALAGNCGE